MIEIHAVKFASPRYEQALALRERLLRVPLGLVMTHEDRLGDAHRQHFVAQDGDTVVGCVSYYLESPISARIKQMVVEPTLQGSGIGARLMEAVEAHAYGEGARRLELHARLNAQGFYAKLGYKAEGEEFLEKTIPHIRMVKDL